MERALREARRAERAGEVPIGAVAACGSEVVAVAHNRTLTSNDPTAHAEVVLLRRAARKLGSHRLTGLDIYVTLEPCCMCAGAMIHARLEHVVFGAVDPKTGAAGSRFQVLCDPGHNHRPAVSGACLADECSEQLKRFFRRKRQS